MRIIPALSLLLGLVSAALAQHFQPSDSPEVTVPVTSPAGMNSFFAANGNDSNPCTQAAPCQTLPKAQSLSYQPGATINFNGGDNFTGCWALTPTNVSGGGSASNPIVVQSYGTGVATWTSNCTGDFFPLLDIAGVNGITVQNLRLVGGNPAANIGILIEGPGDTIAVQNTEITGFAGPDGQASSEIMVLGAGARLSSGCGALNHVTIMNNVLHGATPTSHDRNGIYGYGCDRNITNVVYSNNHVYNMGGIAPTNGALSPNGIAFTSVAGGLAEHNLVHDIGANNATCGGPTGIIAYESDSITIRFNEAYNVMPVNFTAGCDWVGFDLDGGVTNSIVDYNYGHNNGGACLLNFPNAGPNIFRYNVCENNDLVTGSRGQIAINPSLVQVYGNTIYAPPGSNGSGEPPACIFLGYNGSFATGSFIENNLCDFHRTSQFNISAGISIGNSDASAVTAKNNLYSSNVNYWQFNATVTTTLAATQAAGKEQGSIEADPLLAAPGTGATCGNAVLTTGPQPCPSAYRLQHGSPALGAGISVNNDGGRDYYGNATTLHNIGADQGAH